ncbi:unnamed protein product [Phytophthora fragariaefolia]|uniref:Unnamed protein product n=1 Tax=Phytophthora fragariaefolia TaxID=1490495 RepID=A0A9W7D6E0_9STRA|nr:unnamed protein product [Phytophthora fragariaefolia]
MRPTNIAEVILYLEAKVRVTEELGLTLDGAAKLSGILHTPADNFRVAFGHDPPVRVAPMKGRLREGAAPEQDVDPTADPRMTINTRSVNERTEPMPWLMPVLEVVVGELEGSKVFFVLDWFWGYWQLPLHPDSQELYSFVTHRGIYTPTRVPMGATDAVAYCQGVVEEIFGDLLGVSVLAWQDDILGFAEDEDALLDVLDTVLECCEKFGLKLHAKKYQFCSREIMWCGRMISGDGVRHCPERIQGLVDMRPPKTAGELQQFLCAVNWMRQSIPEFTRITTKLYDTLKRAAQHAGSRKKLKSGGDSGLFASDGALGAPESDGGAGTLYTDASQDHWGAILTQLEPGELALPLAEQKHQPLAFLSGRSPVRQAGGRLLRRKRSRLWNLRVEEADFVWPAVNEIGALQQQAQDDGEDLDGAMWNAERQLMMIDEARVDVSTFVTECLYCMTAAGWRIPLPYGETLKATKPNELLHFDFLTMFEGDGDAKYILELKDDMSGYVELIACAHAGADQTYHGLMDWFKRFGVVLLWVSDQGAHFKNEVVKKLQRAIGAHHLFTTAYFARRAGGVSADQLGGKTPLTAFTALPGGAHLHSILHLREPVDAPIEWVDSEVPRHLRDVRVALDTMHTEMVNASEKRRRAARERHARCQGVRLQKFSEGDFVLAATATGRRGHKLALVWRWPKRIVRALNDYTFEVQDIIAPLALSIRHASRLQLYRDEVHECVEELQEQAIYGEGGHLVEALRQCRVV